MESTLDVTRYSVSTSFLFSIFSVPTTGLSITTSVMSCPSSLYDRLGGKPIIELFVGDFYKKMVSDERICGVWKGVKLERFMSMMKMFLRKTTGGEDEGSGGYEGRNMYDVHKKVNNNKFFMH